MNQASNYLMAGHIAQASGSLHPNIAPYGETFLCADGKQLVLAVGSESQFRHLCAALDLDHVCEDARFATNQQRVVHRKELAITLETSFRTKSRDSWTSLLTSAGVPVGAIRSMDEVMESATAKRMIREEVIEGHAARRISGVSFRLES
jgi:crotonobetainyl-CoA:carnitine CoA-transferase CaiB-like acyl-CoA transferase